MIIFKLIHCRSSRWWKKSRLFLFLSTQCCWFHHLESDSYLGENTIPRWLTVLINIFMMFSQLDHQPRSFVSQDGTLYDRHITDLRDCQTTNRYLACLCLSIRNVLDCKTKHSFCHSLSLLLRCLFMLDLTYKRLHRQYIWDQAK